MRGCHVNAEIGGMTFYFKARALFLPTPIQLKYTLVSDINQRARSSILWRCNFLIRKAPEEMHILKNPLLDVLKKGTSLKVTRWARLMHQDGCNLV